MIIISEVVHTGEVHFQVNSCFVEMFSILYPFDEIIFNAEETHVKSVKRILEKRVSNIEFSSFKSYYDVNEYSWGTRIIGECIQIFKIIRRRKSLKNNVYVWTCLFPTGHFFLNFLTLFQNNSKHIVILHGELEFLKTRNKRFGEIFLGFILRLSMKMSSKQSRYIVLGDNIKISLSKRIGKRISKKVYSILHPYNFFAEENLNVSNNKEVLTIGAIGTQMLSKNSNYLFELARFFSDDIHLKKIVFKTIGRVLPELDKFKTELVINLYADSFVSQKEFEFEISKLNFIVFFYDNKAYELCASGAIFEAIRMNVPIISIKNDFFEWLFKSFGEMGFLCDDLKGIEYVVNKLKNGEYVDEIESFKKNIVQFKSKNDLNILSLSLKNII